MVVASNKQGEPITTEDLVRLPPVHRAVLPVVYCMPWRFKKIAMLRVTRTTPVVKCQHGSIGYGLSISRAIAYHMATV